VKTGLTGHTVLLPTDDVAAYQAVIARFTERWQPQTEEERVLVQSLADTDWRLQRIPSLEYGIYALGAEEFAEEFSSEPDPAIRSSKVQTKTFVVHHKKLMSLQSQDARLRRHRQQDEQRLQRLQGDRRYLEAQRARLRAAIQGKELAISWGGALDTETVLREFLEAKQQQERERIEAAQQALRGKATAAPQPGGFEFRPGPGPDCVASRMTAAEYAARFCQEKEIETPSEKSSHTGNRGR
jgi:hypothetical protein